MYCYVRSYKKCLVLCCYDSLVRSCYVFLLPCYLGGIVNVQPFLQKKLLLVLFIKRPPPLQTTLSLASETSLKTKKNHACVGIS
jgi:hypothetical protein